MIYLSNFDGFDYYTFDSMWAPEISVVDKIWNGLNDGFSESDSNLGVGSLVISDFNSLDKMSLQGWRNFM